MLGNTILMAIMCGITAYSTMKIFEKGYNLGLKNAEPIEKEEKVINLEKVEENKPFVPIDNDVLNEWFNGRQE